MSLGPVDVAIFFFVGDPDQFFELRSSFFVLGSIRRLCRCLRSPERVRKAKLHPAGLSLRKRGLISLRIELVRFRVRTFGVGAFGVGLQSRGVNLLCDTVEDQEEERRD